MIFWDAHLKLSFVRVSLSVFKSVWHSILWGWSEFPLKNDLSILPLSWFRRNICQRLLETGLIPSPEIYQYHCTVVKINRRKYLEVCFLVETFFKKAVSTMQCVAKNAFFWILLRFQGVAPIDSQNFCSSTHLHPHWDAWNGRNFLPLTQSLGFDQLKFWREVGLLWFRGIRSLSSARVLTANSRKIFRFSKFPFTEGAVKQTSNLFVFWVLFAVFADSEGVGKFWAENKKGLLFQKSSQQDVYLTKFSKNEPHTHHTHTRHPAVHL